MAAFDGSKFALDPAIQVEPVPDNTHFVFWLPASKDQGYQLWDRVCTAAHGQVLQADDICFTLATLIRTRQGGRGWLGKLLWPRSKGSAGQVWLLPRGGSVEQIGERQADFMLAWTENDAVPLEPSALGSRWPQIKPVQRLGPNLLLLAGRITAADLVTSMPAGQMPSSAQTEQRVAMARQDGDPRKIAAALTDLAAICLHSDDRQRALVLLEEAVTVARSAADRVTENDALDLLGEVFVAAGNGRCALELFEKDLAAARADGNRVAEKRALGGLAGVHSGLRLHSEAVVFAEQALVLARALGDRQQEAKLLWQLGIDHAELGDTGKATACAEAALALLQAAGEPIAPIYTEHLQKYRLETQAAKAPQPATKGRRLFSQTIVVGASPLPKPSLLRMALTAAKAASSLVATGLQMLSPENAQQRLRACASCEQHTGLRCRVCGCFTNVKAWLPHENCPLGKWPKPGA